jgi:hypothetical protein
MAEVGRRATPANALLERLVRMGWLDTADGLIRFGMSRSPDLKWAVTNALWTFGLRRPSEVQAAFVPYTLKDVAKDIRADVLILAGARDHFIPLERGWAVRKVADASTKRQRDHPRRGIRRRRTLPGRCCHAVADDAVRLDRCEIRSFGRACGGVNSDACKPILKQKQMENLKWPWKGTGFSP